MDRYNGSDAHRAFESLCDALGREHDGPARPGRWVLSYGNGAGYRVEQFSEGGGQSTPLGERRRPAREFCQTVNFALAVLGEARR